MVQSLHYYIMILVCVTCENECVQLSYPSQNVCNFRSGEEVSTIMQWRQLLIHQTSLKEWTPVITAEPESMLGNHMTYTHMHGPKRVVLHRHIFHKDILACVKSIGVNSIINGWIPLSCFSFGVLFLFLLARSHTVTYWNFGIEQSHC